jgi:hypothetical protein
MALLGALITVRHPSSLLPHNSGATTALKLVSSSIGGKKISLKKMWARIYEYNLKHTRLL